MTLTRSRIVEDYTSNMIRRRTDAIVGGGEGTGSPSILSLRRRSSSSNEKRQTSHVRGGGRSLAATTALCLSTLIAFSSCTSIDAAITTKPGFLPGISSPPHHHPSSSSSIQGVSSTSSSSSRSIPIIMSSSSNPIIPNGGIGGGGRGSSWYKGQVGRRRATASWSAGAFGSSSVFPRAGGGIDMISSMFRWRKDDDDDGVLVNIESPSTNVRRISSSIVVDRPLYDVWRILTDYDRLADYVPNLTQSKAIPIPPGVKAKGVRLFQEGAQTIIGFNFKASLTMDMEEIFEGEDEKLGQRRIKFKLVDSAMFNDFSGEWRLQVNSRMKSKCGDDQWTYSTKLFYMVTVKPKGPVPVAALEWRIKEDVPTNLRAVKMASEGLPWDCEKVRDDMEIMQQQRKKSKNKNWLADETLGAYIGSAAAGKEEGASTLATAQLSQDEVMRVGVGSSGGGGNGLNNV